MADRLEAIADFVRLEFVAYRNPNSLVDVVLATSNPGVTFVLFTRTVAPNTGKVGELL